MANTKIRLPQLNAESLKANTALSLVFKELDIDKAYLTFDTQNNDVELGSGDIPVILTGATTLAGALSGASFKDEDGMDSNSATAAASQQSIKAYVDAQVTAQDLDFQGDAGGALSIDLDSETLDIAGGTAITTTGSGNEISVALDNTAVTPAAYGAVTKVLSATVDQQGRITAMAHSNIAIPSTQVTDFEEAAEDFIGAALVGGVGLDYAYDDAAGTMTFSAEDSAADNKGAVIVAGTANEITVAYSSGTASVSLPDDVTIGQDLTVTRHLIVNGDQFKIDGETVVMDDTLLEMGTVGKAAPTGATTKDMGILIHQHDGSSASLNFMGWDDSANTYTFRTGVTDGGSGILTGMGAAAAVEVGALTAAATDVGTLGTSGLATLASATVTAVATFNGDVTFGGSGKFAAALKPKTASIDLGGEGLNEQWRELHALKATIDDVQIDGKSVSALDAGANSDLTLVPKGTGSVVMAKVDIAGGEIDGTPIGANAAQSGAFTTLSCTAKALAAGALNINSEAAITLAAADEFAVSDADATNAIKKTTMADIQAYLAANASSKVISAMTGPLAAGDLVSNQNGFPNLGLAALATLNGASAVATKSEVYLNGMLMSRGADGDYSGAATLTEDFAYDTDAAAGSPAPGMIFAFDLVTGDHVVIMVRS